MTNTREHQIARIAELEAESQALRARITERMNSSDCMDANMADLQDLFKKPISYRIPHFQRPYAWGEEVQWKPLWDDIRKVAMRVLNKKEDDKIRPHFMGAIVLQQQRSITGEVEKRIVVDGQQRLTTLQLFIKATEQVFLGQNDTVRASKLCKLTINEENHWRKESDNQTKIRQSSLNDQKAFQEAIRNTYSGDDANKTWAISALDYFKEEVTIWLDDAPENMIDRSDALKKALTEYLKIAVIDLDEDEKPHVIFETLNARGEPLKQSDLIKNTAMYEANVIDDDQRARELWGMFDDKWWQQDIKEGRLGATIHIDRFLRYWMVMHRLKDVTANRVAAEFRNYLEETQSSIETVTSEMHNAGQYYAVIEGARGIPIHVTPEMKTFFRRMKAIELGVVTPVLLWLFTSGVPNDRRQRCIEILESYGVRRKLCGLQTQGLNKIFIGLLQALEGDGVGYADMTILRVLKTHQADNGVWPNDRMLRDHLTTTPMKANAPSKKMVLEAIELHLRTDRSEELGSTSNLEIEHIMPQRWKPENWPLSPENANQDEAENVRIEAIQKIGNLTLTTEKLNKSLSNGPWHEKRQTLGNHSTLVLNRTLLENAPNDWDEAAISARSQRLTEKILQIWPSAEKFAE